MKPNASKQRSAHQDSSIPSNMNVTIAITDLFDFEGQAAPAARPDDLVIEAMVKRQYAFLRQPLKIEIGDQKVTVSFTQEDATVKAEAERLAQRAAKRAANGNYPRAISILKRCLDLQPSLCEARRDLARAYYELGDIGSAKDHTIETLRLNPRDALSLVQLGVIYGNDDTPTAERFLRRALEISPGDPSALTNLAGILLRRGEVIEAIPLFRQAIASAPDIPNPHLGLAVAYCASNEIVLARRALDGFFINAREQDVRSRPVAEGAITLSAQIRQNLAERQYPRGLEVVDQLMAELEQSSGYPVRVEQGVFEDIPCVAIQMAWQHGQDHHLIKCHTGLPEFLRIHGMAHELGRLRLETEARQANKNRLFVMNDRAAEAVALRVQNHLRSRKDVPQDAKELVHAIASVLYYCPINMVVEARLRERLPALSEVQFLSMRGFKMEEIKQEKGVCLGGMVPGFMVQVMRALGGAKALFLDHLYPGPTSYAVAYQDEESFSVAQRLFRHWQSRLPQLGPGDEYTLVDEFGDILGLRGWFEWRKESPKWGLRWNVRNSG